MEGCVCSSVAQRAYKSVGHRHTGETGGRDRGQLSSLFLPLCSMQWTHQLPSSRPFFHSFFLFSFVFPSSLSCHPPFSSIPSPSLSFSSHPIFHHPSTNLNSSQMSSSSLAKDDRSPPSSSSDTPFPSHSQSHQSASNLDRVQSPSNQPRLSLSTQLAPDYHDWVHDVSSPRPVSFGSNNNNSSRQVGRSARREKQPSFTGSAFTNSDREDNTNDGQQQHADDETYGPLDPTPDQSTIHSQADTSRPSSITDRSTTSVTTTADQKPTAVTRLPALDQSRVDVTDPSRPTYKLGTPIVIPKPLRPRKISAGRSQQDLQGGAGGSGVDRPTETSALLGSQNSLRKPQGNGDAVRWTNEGSRRGTARYNGGVEGDETDGGQDNDEDATEEDSLRRPSRYELNLPVFPLSSLAEQIKGNEIMV